MSFLTRLFKKNSDEDYETILSSLASDIQKRQTKLSEIRLRERRSTLLATMYTLATWVAYVSLWYINILPNRRGHTESDKVDRLVKALPVIVGPIVILFTRRIVQVWYKSKGDAEEKTLRELLKQQRVKVEEIKKKTNYYTTRNLIERYDEGSASNTNSPLRQRQMPGQLQPSTPQRQPQQQLQSQPQLPPQPQPQRPNQQTPVVPAGLRNHLSASPFPTPGPPPRKQWYDKLADALLGDDEQPAGASASRFALICEKCFAHNGLVKESMFEDAQYLCPKCGHFNASIRSKKEKDNHRRGLTTSESPLSPPTMSPLSSYAQSRSQSSRHSSSASASASPVSPVENGEMQPSIKENGETSMMEIDS